MTTTIIWATIKTTLLGAGASFEVPAWFAILFAVLIFITFAIIGYYRDKRERNHE